MTKQELKVLKGLIDQKKHDFTARTSDSEILKAVVHNLALDDIKELLDQYQAGHVHQDVINQIQGE